MSYKLEKPYTEKNKTDFITNYGQDCYQERGYTMEIVETDRALYALEPDEIMGTGETGKAVPVKNLDYKELIVQAKQDKFNKEFFSTSLGYIRRNVSMITGDTKDFLSDLLPAISAGVQMGQQVPIITYNMPDFTKEFSVEYMESIQEIKYATAEFIHECFVQLSNDFVPVQLMNSKSLKAE